MLTHSHGGNVIAYLGAIDEILAKQQDDAAEKQSDDRTTAIRETRAKMKELPLFAQRADRKGQKRFDYQPQKRSVMIDELILWGMPVQPETDSLFASEVFKNVYQFYSDEDLVQRVD